MASGSANNARLLQKGTIVIAESPVCVECGMSVELLFRQYTRGIRLGRCGYCCSVADKYIECEFVLIAIDLALHRIQAYRHLLFNRKPFSTHTFYGRLWQLGVAMAALDAHLRHTALSSDLSSLADASPKPRVGGGGIYNGDSSDPFWEAGGLLVAAVVEHVCCAAGAVLCARQLTFNAPCARSDATESRNHTNADMPTLQRGVGVSGDAKGDADISSPRVGGQGDSTAARARGGEAGCGSAPSTTRMYMAMVYPLFFRLLAAFVMIWDQQVAILNTIELLVATMQFVALSAVVGGPATMAAGMGGIEGARVTAATSVVAGLVAKMVGRGLLCRYLGTDARTLTML